MLILLGMLACEPTPTAPPPVTYTVVKGDSLSKIAREYGVTVAALRQANGISGDLIDIDQVLTIPGEGEIVASSAPSAKKAPRKRSSGGGGRSISATSPAPAGGLSMPAEQPCLDGPSLSEVDGDEPEMVASVGLSHSQVTGAMDAFVGQVSRCIDGDWPVGVVTLDITVACSGQVAGVRVSDSGGLDKVLTGCITDTLRYAAFPPHDMPDGFTFGYPLRFSQ
ncbi:MAG: LysM peptidoglycan-binding domain-containing protein [Myxococcota bacterium]|nr:LysM peptidoglycan-binding domain-containing protein [Myxococcota bacterium]